MWRDHRKRGAARFLRDIEGRGARDRVPWCLAMVSYVMVIAVMVTAVNAGATAGHAGMLSRRASPLGSIGGIRGRIKSSSRRA